MAEPLQVVAEDSSASDGPQKPLGQTDTDGKAPTLTIGELDKEFKRYQDDKADPDGGVETRTLVNLCFWAGEQDVFAYQGKMVRRSRKGQQVRLGANILKRRADKMVGKLAAVNPDFDAIPSATDPKAIQRSEVVEKMDRAVDRKVKEEDLRRERWFWLQHGGMCAEFTPYRRELTVEPEPARHPESGEVLYRDKMTGGVVVESQYNAIIEQGAAPQERFECIEHLKTTGDIEACVYGPLQLFCPSGCRGFQRLAPDESVMVGHIRSRAWIEANFDVALKEVSPDEEFRLVRTDLSAVGPALAERSIKSLIPILQGSKGENDPDMFLFVERYQPPSSMLPRGWSGGPDRLCWGGRYTCFIPGIGIVFDGEIPYEDGVPLDDFHWDPVTTTIWTGGMTEHVIQLQKAFNEIIADIREGARKFGKLKLLHGPKFDIAKWKEESGLLEGLNFDGAELVKYLEPPQLAPWLLNFVQYLQNLLTEMSGGMDLFDRDKFPGQLRGGGIALPILIEMMDTEWGPIIGSYGRRLADVKTRRMNRVKQFYERKRIMHYFGKSGRSEVFEFQTDDILRAGTEFTLEVVPKSLTLEMRSMREARLRDVLDSPLAILYYDQRYGILDQEMIAREMEFGDYGAEDRILRDVRFAKWYVGRILSMEPVPDVLDFMPHAKILDELEEHIIDADFYVTYSSEVQQQLWQRAQAHNEILDKQAAMQRQFELDQVAVAAAKQAAQQAASKTAAELGVAEESVANVQSQREMAAVQPDTEPRSPAPGGPV